MMFYAIYSPYGNRTYSKGDTLLRFGKKAGRDAWVENDPPLNGDYHRMPVSREKARRLFPEAFREHDDFCGEAPRWLGNGCWGDRAVEEFDGRPTGGDYAYMR